MKRYPIVVDAEAERDLDDIISYIADHDSIDRALFVATRIERAISGLASFPRRGPHPKELLEYGNRDFREIHFKPYRIIYRVVMDRVVIVLIADGRRDMHALMNRRLLGA
jgi:toxin ParE1/3/4